MTLKITRRSFLEIASISMAGLLAACSKVFSGFTKTATPAASATPDVSLHTYAADDPNILYTGRIDFTDPKKPWFSAPGVYIQARFRGTSAAVMLQDEFIWGTNRNYYDAVIDDTTVVKIVPEKSVTKYPVATGLPYGEHTLTLVKRTEASIGSCQFLGLEFTGQILPAPARPVRRMEFVGDSITCGSGNEAVNGSEQCQEDGWGQPYHNARLSYGAVLARKMKADYHLTAVSGIGLIRNYSFKYDARPMPEVYDSLFFQRIGPPEWDHSRFTPDALVLALGTNDFSPGDSDRESMNVDAWVAEYVKFIQRLRGYYPDASIFVVSSPMLGDRWPTSADTFATDQINGIIKTVSECNSKGDAKVYQFMSSKIVGMGCGTHPNVQQHASMAEELGAFIASVMGW
jgi:hypothetical protein